MSKGWLGTGIVEGIVDAIEVVLVLTMAVVGLFLMVLGVGRLVIWLQTVGSCAGS